MSEAAETDPRAKIFTPLPFRLGEIIVAEPEEGAFDLRHRDDVGHVDLERHTEVEAAREIARFDEKGKFRPLKTAPSLRRGWHIVLRDVIDVREALDYFYPGRIAAFLAQQRGRLRTTPFRETLNRQSGMYRAAARITDEQADKLAAEFCRSEGGCLRTILWRRDAAGALASALLPKTKFDPGHDQMQRGEATVPLLCQEACPLLVAAARGAVK